VTRPVRIEGDVAYVPLSQGYEAVIDAADVPIIAGYTWTAIKGGRTVYASRAMRLPCGKRRPRRIHQQLLNSPPGFFIDHIDGDGLNNRRSNLRYASRVENGQNAKLRSDNTSGFKGVSWDKKARKWRAHIQVNGRLRSLGTFDAPDIAHAAYVKAARESFGDFARAA
jgi:hypothetical protein